MIVTSQRTLGLWPRAMEALRCKYEEKWPGRVRLTTYDDSVPGGVTNTLGSLRQHSPSYTCFLEHHSLSSRDFVRSVHTLTRELDPSTPYGDTLWGILTGYVEDDVLFAVRQPPLVISRATGNSPMRVKMFRSGLWFSEGEKGVAIRKLPTENSEQRESCPDDATAVFVKELSTVRDIDNDEGVDFIGTSGHASEKNLKMGYSFDSGTIISKKGCLYGRSLDGSQLVPVKRNECPKVLSAAGNCLMGHVSDEDCMALGWIHSACVVQMTAYTESTWFGYGGWGVNNYLCEEPGGMTFSEAFFANQQALLHTLHSKYGQVCEETEGLTREHAGLVYDRDCVAFYGDPAWEATLEKGSSHAHYSHSVVQRSTTPAGDGWVEWEYAVRTLKSGKWSRPPVYVFPERVQRVKLISGGEVVLTCRFLLLPLTGGYSAGEQHTVVFQTHTSK